MSNGYRGRDLDQHFGLHESADGELLALADLPTVKSPAYELIVHPDHRTERLESALLTICEAFLWQRAEQEGAPVERISTSTFSADPKREQFLSALGYVADAKALMAQTIRSLHVPIPPSMLPDGFSISNVEGEYQAQG